MRVYIAGSMRGLPEYNYPAFDAAEKRLNEQGYSVVNPANIGRAHFGNRKDLSEDEIDFLMAEELSLLVECEAIYLLKGWYKSKGARKELYHAIGNDLEIILEE